MGRYASRTGGGRLALRDQVIRAAIVTLLAVNIYYAAIEPCTSAEAVVYQRYASHDLLDLWKSPMDVRFGLVYGVLARFATRLGGVSELTIRIPAVLGGLLFWIALFVFCRKLRGWSAVLVFLAIAANPWTFRAFSTANGMSLAVGLLRNRGRDCQEQCGQGKCADGIGYGCRRAGCNSGDCTRRDWRGLHENRYMEMGGRTSIARFADGLVPSSSGSIGSRTSGICCNGRQGNQGLRPIDSQTTSAFRICPCCSQPGA